MTPDPGDVTLATYERTAALYGAQRGAPAPAHVAYLDRIAELVGTGSVLELGSGPGVEAQYLELRGLHVRRTDGTRAFVDLLRADGHDADLLDVRTDDFGGPYDAILADAVLLHLTRAQFADVLRRAHDAVRDRGLLAVTLKEGDGEGWSTAKLDLPRWFTYWRAEPLTAALTASGWTVVSMEHVQGRVEAWLYVLAQAGGAAD